MLVCIQELFLGNQSFVHVGLNLYQLFETDNWKNMRVLIVVKKNIFNKRIIENQTDQVRYPYCIVLDMREIDPVSGKYSKKTSVINLYDNKIGNRYI